MNTRTGYRLNQNVRRNVQLEKGHIWYSRRGDKNGKNEESDKK